VPELDDELRSIAEEGSELARPLPPAEVMRRGDRRRRKRIARDCAIAAAAVIAVTLGVLAGTSAGRQPAPASPGGRPSRPAPAVTRSVRLPTPTPTPSARPSRPARASKASVRRPQPTPSSYRSRPSPGPSTVPSSSPSSSPVSTPTPSPSRR
jgi:hypothetical protein